MSLWNVLECNWKQKKEIIKHVVYFVIGTSTMSLCRMHQSILACPRFHRDPLFWWKYLSNVSPVFHCAISPSLNYVGRQIPIFLLKLLVDVASTDPFLCVCTQWLIEFKARTQQLWGNFRKTNLKSFNELCSEVCSTNTKYISSQWALLILELIWLLILTFFYFTSPMTKKNWNRWTVFLLCSQ